MAYEYDNDNGFRPERPQPPKKDNDIGAWIFIAVMFTVAWPIGLILLLIKLSESGNKKKNARRTTGQSGQRTSQRVGQTAQAEKARTAVKQVTQTPDYTDKGAKVMKIIGAAVAILGAFFLVQQVDYFELRYAIKWHEWMDLLRQVFYPMGMMAGGVSLLLGSGAMKRRQRRFATYLRTVGQKQAVPLDYLARAADVSRKRVEKDVNLMLEKGMELARATDKRRALMLGDSLTSDIAAAKNAGIDACWFNPKGAANDKGLPIAYEIASLDEVDAILDGTEGEA